MAVVGFIRAHPAKLVRLAGIITVVWGFVYAGKTISKPLLNVTGNTVRSTDPTSSTEEKSIRTKKRGQAASMCATVGFSIGASAVDAFAEVNSATSTALIGMLCGGTFGFIMDNAMGSEVGFDMWKRNPSDAMKYGLGTLTTGMYIRYIVTILFDMFISMIVYKPLFEVIRKLPYFNQAEEFKTNFVTSVLVGTLTFLLYTNMTRFDWAYPTTNVENENEFLGTREMMLATSVAAALFLSANTKVESSEVTAGVVGEDPPQQKRGFAFDVNETNTKLFIVLGLMFYSHVSAKYLKSQADYRVVSDNLLTAGSLTKGLTTTTSNGDGEENPVFKIKTNDAWVEVDATTYTVQEYISMEGEYHIYRLRKKQPSFKYEPNSVRNPTTEEIKDRSGWGILMFFVIAAVTGALTIFGTTSLSFAKDPKKIYGSFVGFLAMIAILILPGMTPSDINSEAYIYSIGALLGFVLLVILARAIRSGKVKVNKDLLWPRHLDQKEGWENEEWDVSGGGKAGTGTMAEWDVSGGGKAGTGTMAEGGVSGEGKVEVGTGMAKYFSQMSQMSAAGSATNFGDKL
jgi:hypothetical protein